MSAQRSSSFRIVELVVVVVIALFLVALLLPMLQVGRGPDSRSVCLNNMRQCAIGLVSYEQMHGTFPGYANKTAGGKRGSWVVLIMPAIEQFQLYQNWNRVDLTCDLRPSGDGGNRDQYISQLGIVICPTECRKNTYLPIDRLSYAVNSGSARTANDFSQPLTMPLGWIEDVNSGVCFNRARADYDTAIKQPNRFPPFGAFSRTEGVSQKFINEHDGATNTLLLSENVQAATWATDPRDDTLPFESEFQMRQSTALVWFITGQEDNAYPPTAGIREANLYDADSMRINTRRELALPLAVRFRPANRPHHTGGLAAARPSSNHSGGINAMFCGGNGRFLSEDIDYRVYTQLMTPNGADVVVDFDAEGKPISASAPAGTSQHVATPWKYHLQESDL